MSTMAIPYDTIVVGLGAAGATAASTLARAGCRVLALEAQDRVGGRVKTVPFGDGVVEEGAEWIHGTHPSRVYDLAMQCNVPIVEQDMSVNVYLSDGSLGKTELVLQLIEYCLEVIDDQPTASEPLGQYVTRRLQDHLKEKYPSVLRDKVFLNEFLEIMEMVLNNYESADNWNQVNVHTTYEQLKGHLYVSWREKGFRTFFEILLNKYNNGVGLPSLDIKLNKEVTLIKWPQNPTDYVEVTCKGNEQYTAKNVIITVSLGVLKERFSTLFEPMLPADKIVAIDKLSMGVAGKVILSFAEAWWPNRIGHLFVWDATEKKNLKDDEKWLPKFAYTSFPKGSSNTITFWTSGHVTKLVVDAAPVLGRIDLGNAPPSYRRLPENNLCCVSALETLPEEIVKNKAVGQLRRFLGENFTIPDPTGVIRSTWYSNPFIRGSYSYENLLTDQYPDARSTLAAPLADASGQPRVLFAGEATNVTHFSTVHGASDSGYREAMRLLKTTD